MSEINDEINFPWPVPQGVIAEGSKRWLEVEGVHIYSGEEWVALAPNRMQDYARLRLIQCGKQFAELLDMPFKEEAAFKVEIDELAGKVYLRCLQWIDVTRTGVLP